MQIEIVRFLYTTFFVTMFFLRKNTMHKKFWILFFEREKPRFVCF